MPRPTPLARTSFTQFELLSTRWHDNDVYGHMNNTVHYQLFDTAVNGYLLRKKVLDIHTSQGVFLVVSSGCDYFAELAFPDQIEAGLRVARLGNSSVTYQIALFRNDATEAAAQGHFTHVHVDRQTRRPLPMQPALRAGLEELVFPNP